MVFQRPTNPVPFFSHLIGGFLRVSAFLRGSICMLAVAMLLLFPAVRPHNFADHFRAPEVRRSVAQNTPVAPMHDEAQIEPALWEIVAIAKNRSEHATEPHHRDAEVAGRVCVFETLHRLKLGPHRQADTEAHL